MNKTIKETVNLIDELTGKIGKIFTREVLVCPPFTSLYEAKKTLSEKAIKLGAQDLYWEKEGAFTGEVSALMLKDAGCEYVIIGHSERRGYFGETDEEVNKKIKSAFNYGLKPIMCVGESLTIREAGKAQEFVKSQIIKGLEGLKGEKIEYLVIAYEPIWAIGTGKTDSPPEANKTCGLIRETVADIFGFESSQAIRILYGGSVKPENIDAFMKEPEIDGALVGGASLKADSFARIVKYE